MTWWPRAIVFDLDGTLVDSFPAIAIALDRALVTSGRGPVGLDWVRRHVGRGLDRLVRDAVGDDPAAVDELVRGFGEAYDEVLEPATPAFPGVGGALTLLAANAHLAVASNKPVVWSRRLVSHLGWSALLPVVLGPEDAGVPKPDPAMAWLALSRLGVAPHHALLVGDMVVDVATGHAAGLPVVGVAGEDDMVDALLEAGAVAVLAGVPQLPTWLEVNHPRFATASPSRRHDRDPE
jgi:phosphoglycolate phosphatase